MEWEYRIVQLDEGGYFSDPESPSEADLNELGRQGWELAASLDSSGVKSGGRTSSTTALVFKRPVDTGEQGETSPGQ